MTKSEFVQTLRAERASWQALLAGADEARMVQPGVTGEWSLKDIVAHVAAYEGGLVAWLEGAARGEALVLSQDLDHPDLDYRNALLFARHRDRPLAEVLAEAEGVYGRLLASWRRCPKQSSWTWPGRNGTSSPAGSSAAHCGSASPTIPTGTTGSIPPASGPGWARGRADPRARSRPVDQSDSPW